VNEKNDIQLSNTLGGFGNCLHPRRVGNPRDAKVTDTVHERMGETADIRYVLYSFVRGYRGSGARVAGVSRRRNPLERSMIKNTFPDLKNKNFNEGKLTE